MTRKGTFTADNQPVSRRGKSEKTKILEAMKRESKTEEEFYDMLVQRAFNPEDNFAFKEILARMSPLKKAVMPSVEFDFDKSASPTKQAAMALDAVSNGDIPPDVAVMLIGAIKNASDIEINTEIKQRLEKLEAMLNERIS